MLHILRGELSGIDATACVVTPGFIELHALSGLMILAEP
jgi:N-acyl-D-aspartate/D-glutamate deacylase